jgi:two-component system, OmpR family, alkaline phosphatase synthesis response regulator PhoP
MSPLVEGFAMSLSRPARWILAVLLSFSATPLGAQSRVTAADVTGTVLDESGAPLPGVAVTVTNVHTNVSRVTAPLVRGRVMPTQGPTARPVDLVIASTHEWTSRSLATILAPHGYVVDKTFTRAQTLQRLRTNPPDALIIDEQLPDVDGFALCSELTQENLISPSTPVFLALSRSPTRRDRMAALRAGAWSCLGEPVDAEELMAMLDVFVSAKLDADQARSSGLIDDATGVYNLRGLIRRAEELAASASRRHVALCCVLLALEIESPTPAPADVDSRDTPSPPLWVLRNVAAARGAPPPRRRDRRL